MQIQLRQWTTKDVDEVLELIPKIDSKFLRYDFPSPYTKQDAIEYVDKSILLDKNAKGMQLAILVDNKIIGNISMHLTEYNIEQGTIGYYILDSYKGQGIVTKAVNEILDLTKLKYPQVKEILAFVDERNYASAKVLSNNGFNFYRALLNQTIKETQIVNVKIFRKLI